MGTYYDNTWGTNESKKKTFLAKGLEGQCEWVLKRTLFTNRSNKRCYWAYVSKTRAAYWSKGCKKKACRGAKRKPTGPWKFTKKTFRPTKRNLRRPIIAKLKLSTLTRTKKTSYQQWQQKGISSKVNF
jgi:hypothetical protein